MRAIGIVLAGGNLRIVNIRSKFSDAQTTVLTYLYGLCNNCLVHSCTGADHRSLHHNRIMNNRCV